MGIQVDDRAGSAQLAPKLRQLGCEVDLCRMDFGDVAFDGKAHGGSPVSVGIEVKTIDDCLACITSGRFAGHQLPGLVKCYDHIWLLIQGEWRMATSGALEYRRTGHGGGQYWTAAGGGQRAWMWKDFEGWINSVTILGGIRVHRVGTWREGAQWLKTLYSWFQRDEHKSVQVVYGGKQLFPDTALLTKPSLVRRVAAQLPGIMEKRSSFVAQRFKTMQQMVNASVDDWAKIEIITKSTGRSTHLGKVVARKVHQAIHQNGVGT